MCGIVGYIGKSRAQNVMLGGLKRLEYRGYDSAGVVTLDTGGESSLLKVKGKVAQLEQLVSQHQNNDHVGIGHTRWATHGAPSEINAHPQQAGDIFLVHNGIIENYRELKEQLTGHKFVSDTDTEVLASLIESFYKKDVSLLDAVSQALKLVVGTYGIAVVSQRQPNEIVVARLGSPLVIGLGHDENLIASDASALLGYTDQAIYLNDGELARVTRDDVQLFDLATQPINKRVETIETDLAAIQKQGYDHFLLKEIMEQPTSLAATLGGRLDAQDLSVKLGGLNLTDAELHDIQHVTIVGCGTAYHAGMLAAYYLEQMTDDVTIDVVIASEFRYRSAHIPANSVALIVSQSGETADTLACLREIKKRGVPTLGIVNVVGSTIAREVDGGIYVHAGPEISVASTKAFTSQVAAMIMFGAQLAQAKGVSRTIIEPFLSELAALPDEIKKLLAAKSAAIKRLADHYYRYNHAIYMGRDTAFPAALEGALKLKEISYIDANAYAAGELKHGPLALVDDRFFEVVLLLRGRLFGKTVSNLSEVASRGGHILVITNAKNQTIEAEHVLELDTSLDLLAPILLNVAQQLFAYFIAVKRGNDVDQPRNLAKSVTTE